jgi:hypothetical protein
MSKLRYKPLGLVTGVAAGALAGVLFKQVWKVVSGKDDAPEATDTDRGLDEILTAAALQGAIFAMTRAVVTRSAVRGLRSLTGG